MFYFKKNSLLDLIINLLILSITLVILFSSYAYFVIPYKIIKQGGENQRVIVDGDALVLFDEKIGFIANKNSVTIRNHQNLNLKYEVITDKTGARVSNKFNKSDYLNNQIISIGGSFTWGHGINNEKTFSSILERKLNTRVKNYGMASYGTLQSYQILKNHKDDAKLIIYGFIDDHINRNVSTCTHSYGIYCIKAPTVMIDEKKNMKITSKIRDNNIIKMQNYSKRLTSQKLFALENFSLGFSYLKDSFLRRLERYNKKYSDDQKLEIEKFIIQKMNIEAKKKGAKLLIVNVGIGLPNVYFKKILNMKFDENIFFLDASFFDNFEKSELLIEIDNHPNLLGHEKIAEKIYKTIIKKKLIN